MLFFNPILLACHIINSAIFSALFRLLICRVGQGDLKDASQPEVIDSRNIG
jgi:hypothetical protein